MIKLRATKNQMRGYYRILSIGYCDAQYLLKSESPYAYSAGVNGWACDYYDIDGVLISTGYSPLANKNMINDYKLIREYDEKARESTMEATKLLLREMIGKLTPKKGQ